LPVYEKPPVLPGDIYFYLRMGVGHTDLVDAYNAGLNGEDISRTTRENAAAGNYSESVEAMYNAGQADAKTGSVDTGVSDLGSASAESLQGINPAAEMGNTNISETETSKNFELASTVKTEQSGTTTTEKSGSEVNTELEQKLASFGFTNEQRAVADKVAKTGDLNQIPGNFDKATVQKILQGAEVIKEFKSKNGVDIRKSEGYNNSQDSSGSNPIYNANGDPNIRATRRFAFDKIRNEGIDVDGVKFKLNEHAYNSMFKSGRKDIMPADIIDALKTEPIPGTPGSIQYINPKTGTTVFVNPLTNEIVGIWPAGFNK